MKNIKLIWDFYGERAEKTASHHLTHLHEFMEKNNYQLLNSGLESNADFHFLAFVTLTEDDVTKIKYQLKPHRAFVVEPTTASTK